MSPDIINTLSMDLPAFIIGIGIHEFCHAWAADRLGDPTPREQGRVSLNPMEHLDPVGTLIPLMLAAAGSPVAFGWGRPVTVDPARLRPPGLGYGLVALAGPLGNLLLCLLAGGWFAFTASSPTLLQALRDPTVNFLYRLLARVFTMNLGLLLFNLLPIPPLDGSKVLMWLGGEPVRAVMQRLQAYNLAIFLLMVMTNAHSQIITPLFLRLTHLLTGKLWLHVLRPSQFVLDFL